MNKDYAIEKLQDAAYEAYKIDWIHCNLTAQQQIDAIANYIDEAITEVTEFQNDDIMTVEDYIYDTGYGNGSIYVCKEEFLGAEYRDVAYMTDLIGGDNYKYLIENDDILKDKKEEFEKFIKEHPDFESERDI